MVISLKLYYANEDIQYLQQIDNKVKYLQGTWRYYQFAHTPPPSGLYFHPREILGLPIVEYTLRTRTTIVVRGWCICNLEMIFHDSASNLTDWVLTFWAASLHLRGDKFDSVTKARIVSLLIFYVSSVIVCFLGMKITKKGNF